MPFVKGDPNINRTGLNKGSNALKQLEAALEAEGTKRGVSFWAVVAEKAFDNRDVMVAIAKKFIPDMSKMEVEGSMEVTEMPTVRVAGLPLELHIGEN